MQRHFIFLIREKNMRSCWKHIRLKSWSNRAIEQKVKGTANEKGLCRRSQRPDHVFPFPCSHSPISVLSPLCLCRKCDGRKHFVRHSSRLQARASALCGWLITLQPVDGSPTVMTTRQRAA